MEKIVNMEWKFDLIEWKLEDIERNTFSQVGTSFVSDM